MQMKIPIQPLEMAVKCSMGASKSNRNIKIEKLDFVKVL